MQEFEEHMPCGIQPLSLPLDCAQELRGRGGAREERAAPAPYRVLDRMLLAVPRDFVLLMPVVIRWK